MKKDENGFYLYPPRPEALPNEEDYPKKYTLKTFTQEKIKDDVYQNSIRGYTICRMQKSDEIKQIVSNKTLTVSGYVPGYSNLHFRSMQLGVIKSDDGWLVVERNSGINLMPIETPVQMSLIPTEVIITGKTREQATKIAEDHVKTFTDEQWIDLQKQLDYELSGIQIEYIRTPEQEQLEAKYNEKIRKINLLNDAILKEKNFIAQYGKVRIHKNSAKRTKMVLRDWIRTPEKIDHRNKAKFFCFQKNYNSSIEIEGIVFPIKIDGLTEITELMIVKGSQFKGTIVEKEYSANEYIICEPYTGSLISYKRTKSIKETLEKLPENLMVMREPEHIERINTFIQIHNEKIQTLQSGGDISKYLELDEAA
ncbi:hypothetical protein F4Z99_17440 [Candidatus Poribacteria bacterium]|nr:hypothetical protein [Candidatus Poribacteria bacterium]